MKLRAKIYPQYLKQILSGEKTEELRQLETITLVDAETGDEYEFEITNIGITSAICARDKHPDVKWDDSKPVIVLKLGEEVKV